MGLLAARERARALSSVAAAVELRRVCPSVVEVFSPSSCWRDGALSSLLLGCISVVWSLVITLFRVSTSVFLCLCVMCVFVIVDFFSSLVALGGNPDTVSVFIDGETIRCEGVCLSLFFLMIYRLCVS